MNILVQYVILNYPNIHSLGKTSLYPTMVPAFHPVVYQTMSSQIQTLSFVWSQLIEIRINYFLTNIVLDVFEGHKMWWLSNCVII